MSAVLQWNEKGRLMDEAIARLEKVDSRKSHIARLRLFGRLPVDQIALALGLDATTVSDDWQFTRAWLAREVGHPTT